jgi:peptidoglycan-associated lipoprotein
MKWSVLSVSVPLLFAAACAHQEAKPQSPIAAAASPVPAPAAPAAPAEATCSEDSACGSSQLCIRSRCVDVTPGLAECATVRVHFGFDRADLEQRELPELQRISRCLTADQGMHVIVEGNADERGTAEYNLALGDRRASAVERYLERLGASRAQLRTVSYGKEHPLCTEHDEACWATNRRAAVKTAQASAN